MHNGMVRIGQYYQPENERGLTLKDIRDMRRFNVRGEALG